MLTLTAKNRKVDPYGPFSITFSSKDRLLNYVRAHGKGLFNPFVENAAGQPCKALTAAVWKLNEANIARLDKARPLARQDL